MSKKPEKMKQKRRLIENDNNWSLTKVGEIRISSDITTVKYGKKFLIVSMAGQLVS